MLHILLSCLNGTITISIFRLQFLCKFSFTCFCISQGYTAKGYELRPNAWKENLQIGDRVSINGIIFRIVQPNHGSSHSGKSTSQAGSRPSSRRNSAKASEDNDSESNGELQRSGSRISKSSGDAPTESAYGSLDIDVEVRIREVYTDDHMQLDRPWLLDDVHNLEIYKVMPLVFYQKPFLFVSALVIILTFCLMRLNNCRLGD